MSDATTAPADSEGASVPPALRHKRPRNWLLLVHLELQDWLCCYCGAKMKRNGRLAERPTLDHLTPASRMGRTSLENTAAACGGCNEDKGHLTRADRKSTRLNSSH